MIMTGRRSRPAGRVTALLLVLLVLLTPPPAAGSRNTKGMMMRRHPLVTFDTFGPQFGGGPSRQLLVSRVFLQDFFQPYRVFESFIH